MISQKFRGNVHLAFWTFCLHVSGMRRSKAESDQKNTKNNCKLSALPNVLQKLIRRVVGLEMAAAALEHAPVVHRLRNKLSYLSLIITHYHIITHHIITHYPTWILCSS
jgi:hypothetical protein